MPKAYLTIDDSPSPYTGRLLDFLKKRNLQAMFFCRGHLLAENTAPMIRAAKEGHIIANHAFSHTPSGLLGYEAMTAEIECTENLIDDIYHQAGRNKPGLYFRFPYLDRGNGQKTEQEYDDLVNASDAERQAIFGDADVVRLQTYLKNRGYQQPFEGVTHPLYALPEIRDAADCLLTFTSYDWMLTARHIGKHPYQTINDLKQRIDNDPYLHIKSSVHIVLFHDDRECILDDVCELIDHMLECGITFKRIEG